MGGFEGVLGNMSSKVEIQSTAPPACPGAQLVALEGPEQQDFATKCEQAEMGA